MKANLLYLMCVVCLMTSCIEENFDNHIVPDAENEVQFSVTVKKDVKTRTLYGDETSDGKSIAVNWVHGDIISVYGAGSNTQADYSVNTVKIDESTGEPELDAEGKVIPVSGQNYANSLDKKSVNGVQWGNGESDFYAVYPSTGHSFTQLAGGGISTKTSIRTTQNNKFEPVYGTDGKTIVRWVGTPYTSDLSNPTMQDAVMFACTPDVEPSDNIVNLRFEPFATVLKFTLNGLSSTSGTTTAYVNQIIIKAPDNMMIAGDFDLAINEVSTISSAGVATATPINGASTNIVTLQPNYLPLSNGIPVEFSIFAIPHADLKFNNSTTETLDNELWTVTIETATQGSYTYKIRPTLTNPVSLAPGQIHKINVPTLEITDTFEFDESKWIEYIPRNVYLTELSVPGAWYSTDSEYQGSIGYGTDVNVSITNEDGSTTTVAVDSGLKTLYDAGVRAYHIDCRLTNNTNTNGVDYEKIGETTSLVCAGTDKSGIAGSSYTAGSTVLSKIQDLDELLRSRRNSQTKKVEEYVVVVLTIAEKPLTRDQALSSDDAIYGTIDPAYVLPAIYDVIDAAKEAGCAIYDTPITKNTTINDVLGKIVVMVNANTTSKTFMTYGAPSALIADNLSLWTGSGYNITNVITQGVFDSMQTRNMFWGNTQSDLICYSHFAQRTADSGTDVYGRVEIMGTVLSEGTTFNKAPDGVPTFGDRQSAVDDIIENSDDIYSQKKHDGWFQIGIGGYRRNRIPNALNSGIDDEAANHEELAKVMNPYMLGKINEKLAGIPSPVGVVLMNYCAEATYSGPSLVQAILELNGKFYLNRNHEQQEWPNNGGYPPYMTPNTGGTEEGEGEEL